jgi:short-subunit dehydrogenase
MKKQNILSTGASTGFGFITAKTLATNGHAVFATLREMDEKNKNN